MEVRRSAKILLESQKAAGSPQSEKRAAAVLMPRSGAMPRADAPRLRKQAQLALHV